MRFIKEDLLIEIGNGVGEAGGSEPRVKFQAKSNFQTDPGQRWRKSCFKVCSTSRQESWAFILPPSQSLCGLCGGTLTPRHFGCLHVQARQLQEAEGNAGRRSQVQALRSKAAGQELVSGGAQGAVSRILGGAGQSIVNI